MLKKNTQATGEQILEMFSKFTYKPNFMFEFGHIFETGSDFIRIKITHSNVLSYMEEERQEIADCLISHFQMHGEAAIDKPLWIEHYAKNLFNIYKIPISDISPLQTLDDWSLHLERLILEIEIKMARGFIKWDGLDYPEYIKRGELSNDASPNPAPTQP